MSDTRLKDAARSLARSMFPPIIERQETSIRAAFDIGGAVKPSAISRSLPPLTYVWYLDGTLSNSANVDAEIPLGRDATLLSIEARSKVAPSTPCQIRLTASGAEVEIVAIQAGQSSGRSTIQRDSGNVSAGSVLRLDVIQHGGASDVTIAAHYTVAE